MRGRGGGTGRDASQCLFRRYAAKAVLCCTFKLQLPAATPPGGWLERYMHDDGSLIVHTISIETKPSRRSTAYGDDSLSLLKTAVARYEGKRYAPLVG